MQSRFWVSTHRNFTDAKTEKDRLQQENPDKVYQIRAGRERDTDVFRVVERLKNNEAKVVQENHRPKRKKKKREIDTSWIRI